MAARWANRVSATLMLLLSFIALLTVATAFLQPPRPMPADEGAAARIFQLSIAIGGLFGVLFLATADWARPARAAVPAIVATSAVIVAFAGLYYLEHFYLY